MERDLEPGWSERERLIHAAKAEILREIREHFSLRQERENGEASSEAWDAVNKPRHYWAESIVEVGGRLTTGWVECRRIIAALELNYNLGSAFAYLWRARFKGSTIQDLEKCVFYLKAEIEALREAEGAAKRPE